MLMPHGNRQVSDEKAQEQCHDLPGFELVGFGAFEQNHCSDVQEYSRYESGGFPVVFGQNRIAENYAQRTCNGEQSKEQSFFPKGIRHLRNRPEQYHGNGYVVNHNRPE